MPQRFTVLSLACLMSASTLANTEPCPEQFYTVPLPDKALYCRLFNKQLPASLSYHFPVSPAEAVDYYQRAFKLVRREQQKDRFVLTSPEQPWNIVVSTDGEGTQVDVLVRSQTTTTDNTE